MPTVVEFQSAGVYGIEVAPRRANEGVSPAKMGIVGWTDQGPSNVPIEVRSFKEFTRRFGGLTTLGVVPTQVRAFFGQGGQRAWVVRATPSDAVKADVEIDALPGPTKWTFVALGEGEYGNDITIRFRGNRNFLDRTVSPPAYTKYDLQILVPADFDPDFLIADETFSAIQFTDPLAADYLTNAVQDPRRRSQIVALIEGAGGLPSALASSNVEDEDIGDGAPPQTQFAGTLASTPVLDGTVRIVAGGAQVDDETQTPTPAIDGIATGFTFTLPTAPILDGSLRLFYANAAPVVGEAPAVTGLIDGLNQDYTIAAGALSDKVHKETTAFRIRFAKTAPSSPENLTTIGGVAAPYDLSTTPLTDTPVHPGTVSIAVDEDGVGATTITDDGNGNLVGTSGTVLPGGGTIDYDTGAMTGITANLTALSSVDATYNTSGVITKAATTDNLALGVALVGDVDGAGTNTIDLVDSVTTPTGNGLLDFRTDTAPISGTTIYVDFQPLGVVESDVAGVLTGDVGVGTNSADFTTGDVDVELAGAPQLTTTIDADYQTGLVVTDDGLGNLVGDVDAAGANTIDYATGAYDFDFSTAPVLGSDILANYSVVPQFVDYPLTGGLNGTAVTRADISDASLLEDDQLGLYALDRVEDPLNVILPDFEGSSLVQFDLVDYTLARNTRFAILGFANGTTYPEAIQYNLVTQGWDARTAAIYWPNVFYVNQETDLTELVPVTGFVAGVYARTAQNKNVGKAPAGVEDGLLDADGIVGPEFERQVNDVRVRDDLYQSRINPLFNSTSTGFVVWGARSLSREARWTYIQARLLHNFLMDGIRRQLLWAVFENNGPNLWAKIENVLRAYMGTLFEAGFFAGTTEQQAFFVTCNRSNNNEDTISQGRVIVDVGFSPFKPAEFIEFTLQQPASTTTI